MSIPTLQSPNPTSRPSALAPANPTARREYPARDFGVGYGRSSGYATQRHYASSWNGQPRFRCS